MDVTCRFCVFFCVPRESAASSVDGVPDSDGFRLMAAAELAAAFVQCRASLFCACRG